MAGGVQNQEHQRLVNEILMRFGARQDLTLWKNNTGGMKVDGRFLRFGLKGSPDIIGIKDGGLFVGIEVKTGNALQSPEQRLFEAMTFKRGGIYILARSVEDVEEGLDSVFNHSVSSHLVS